MTQEQFKRELDYQISMNIANRIKKEGIINGKDYKVINEFFIKKYKPPIGQIIIC
ncbi:MAG: hypothetical protein LBJ32_03810 [Oscillospiraceae bacterium]|jgi:hypothetical protein|nr:hypothetical protein [Oscillospiraceae bacterium]